MLLTKNNIFILAIIIMSIVGYQYYITLPPSTFGNSRPSSSSGSTSGKTTTQDLSELIKLQNDLKKQQSEIKNRLEDLKLSIDNVNDNIDNRFSNNIDGGNMDNNNNNDDDDENNSQIFNNKRNRRIPKIPYQQGEGSENSIAIPSSIEYEERLKKTALDQPNTCIPLEGKLLCLPNFIVIGTMKSGTTFLDYYLQKHPQIAHHNKKEVWFFNSYYGNGIEWYTKHFEQYTSLENQKLIGEATPFYINNPNTAPRLYSTLKNAKLILLLRDPVERSLSQYYFSIQWLKKNKSPPLNYTFEQLIHEEADVIETCVRGHERYREAFNERKRAEERGEVDLAEPFDLVDPFYTLHSEKRWTFYKDCIKCDRCFQQGSILHTSGHPTFGMLAKSLYYEQLDYWLNYFPLSQIHIIRYEDIALHPELVLSELEDYLAINHFDYGEFKPKNVVQHDPMDDEIRLFLKKYFEEDNKKLYKLLGRDFEWQK